MGRKTPSKAAKSYPPISSREEADEAIREIGSLFRAKDQFEARLTERVSEMKANVAAQVKPLADALKAKLDSLHAWAEAHKGELLEGDKRSAKLAQGTLGWRWNPPAVRVTGEEDQVIAALERLNLGDLVRTKREIDKEAVLADPNRVEGIAGLKVTRTEQFWVKHAEIEVEQVKTSRTVQGADVRPKAELTGEAALRHGAKEAA